MPLSASADEQVIQCAIETKIEIDEERGTRRLDPEDSGDQFKLFYKNDELYHVEKMPRMSSCKDEPSVSISSDLVELSCISTLFKNYVSYYVVDRYTGEYRSDHISGDGKLLETGTCRLAKPQF